MGQIAEVICGPLIKMLEERIINNEIKRKRLQNKKKEITMVFEQIQRENARSSASRPTSFDDVEKFECSQSSDTETHIETVIDPQAMMDSIALDEILLGNIPRQSLEEVSRGKSEASVSETPLCSSADELCISSSVGTSDGNECFQADMPSTSRNNCTVSPNQEMNVVSTSSSKKHNLPIDSPPDSPKQSN